MTLVIAQKLVQVAASLDKSLSEIKFLQESEKETKEDLNKKNAVKIQQHINMYNTLAKEMEALTQELQDAKTRLAATEESKSAAQDLENASKRSVELSASLETLKDELRASQASQKALLAEFDAFKSSANSERESLSREVDSLRRESSEHASRFEEAQKKEVQRLLDLQAELEELHRKNSNSEAERERLTLEKSALEADLQAARAKTAELEALLLQEREQMQRLQENFASAMETDGDDKAKLVSDLAVATALQQSHEAQISQLKEQLKQLSAFNDSSMTELKALLATRDVELDELSSAKTALQDGNAVLKQQLTQYMDEVGALKGQLVEARAKYDKILLSSEDQSGKLQHEIQQREKESARIRELLVQKDEQAASQQKSIDSLTRQIHEMTELDAARDGQMKNLNDELARSRNELGELQNQFASQLDLLVTKQAAHSASLEERLEASSKKLSDEQLRANAAEEARAITIPQSPSSSLLARSAVWRNQTQLASLVRGELAAMTGVAPSTSGASGGVQTPSPTSTSASSSTPVSASAVGGTESSEAVPDSAVAAGVSNSAEDPQSPNILSSSWWTQIFT